MQGLELYDKTLRLWSGARAAHPDLGLTLPADIRRTERDASALAADGARLRLCIGSYPVARGAGYRSERDKSKALVRCIRRVMEGGGYAMVASHDPTIIDITQDLAARNAVAGFEFQMFYGVRPLEQRRLADVGCRSRTYLPFGPAWFEYLTTRIAARPRTLFSYLRAVGTSGDRSGGLDTAGAEAVRRRDGHRAAPVARALGDLLGAEHHRQADPWPTALGPDDHHQPGPDP
ncbi:hypothetical protein [Tessaracoccus coleopterorum]|uniref:hypothetical protein n=1 Tax=Tessaracoccus coleopterorum TaxID=2714950 RepID=UPI001E4E4B18|nr:hypothetical protein [Tessaracoccus coleopterorum]